MFQEEKCSLILLMDRVGGQICSRFQPIHDVPAIMGAAIATAHHFGRLLPNTVTHFESAGEDNAKLAFDRVRPYGSFENVSCIFSYKSLFCNSLC